LVDSGNGDVRKSDVGERNFVHAPIVSTSAYFCKQSANTVSIGESEEPGPAAHGVRTSATSLATA
jgi:hypothetical protein